MTRRLREVTPGQPLHVVQRGNNRAPMFITPDDFEVFKNWLAESCRRFGCVIHAYVFMTNHVHLLLTPGSKASVSRVMQYVGGRYVPWFNARHARTGTLWEGRFRSAPIDTERYLFTCHRYIELNPVRAGMTANAASYVWSSHRANAFGVHDPLVTPHERYLALGCNESNRLESYRTLFEPRMDTGTLDAIRTGTRRGWTLGGEKFCAALEPGDGPSQRRRRKRL